METQTATRYALTLAYDGSRFFGWQKQAEGVATVQAALEHALSQIAGEPVSVIAAGRTDTGVHATAQVVHFDSRADRPLSAWVRGVNAHLPQGIAVHKAQIADSAFHARFDASGRHYRYLLESAPVRSPLLYGRAGWTHYALNDDAMRQAAQLLVGEHDFSSFRAAQCQAKSPVKTMYAVHLQRTGSLLKLDLHANAFLHHMVRNIMGALVYVGCGRMSVAQFGELIETRSRLHAPPTFMPDGLYLTGVDYPERWHIEPAALPDWL